MTAATARLASAADVDEILRLAQVLYASMNTRTYPVWRAEARSDLLERIGRDLIAVVADDGHEEGRLASMAVAVLGRGIRSPRRPTTVTGYIEWMATDAAHRGEGIGTSVLSRLLDELRGRNVTAVNLNSSDPAITFYQRAGFSPEGPAAMRLRLLPVPKEALPEQ